MGFYHEIIQSINYHHDPNATIVDACLLWCYDWINNKSDTHPRQFRRKTIYFP